MSFVELFKCKHVGCRSSGVVEHLVPVGDVVFLEGGESVENVVCGGVGLRVQEGAITVDQGAGGYGKVIGYLAAEPYVGRPSRD